MEGAGKNLRAEVSKDDFDYYQAQAAKTWNKQLSKIEVKSSDTDDLVKFYTASVSYTHLDVYKRQV